MKTISIGVDVSRDKLDFAVPSDGMLTGHYVTANDSPSIKAFFKELAAISGFKIKKCLFCMEQTGYYVNVLLAYLLKKKASVVVENSLKILNSSGLARGKSDKIDSIKIAEYAYRYRDGLLLWKPRRQILDLLANLSALRSRLISVRDCIATPIGEQQGFIPEIIHQSSKKLCQGTIASVRADLLLVDQEINSLIAGDDRIRRLMEVMTSVPQIGIVTALQIIIATNEFQGISCAKKFACYAGVAPFPNELGVIVRRREVSKMANKRLRSVLHMCALVAMRNVPDLKAYYERKVKEGKPKLLVINAIRFKLITRIFACVDQDRFYESCCPKKSSSERITL
jgi:transposase